MGNVRDIAMKGGHLVITAGKLQTVSDTEAIAQAIELRCSFIRGEWFLDLTAGVPFYELIWQKNPNLVAVREVFRKVIAGTLGVVEVLAVDLRYVGARKLEVKFSARTDAGLLSNRTITVEDN